MFNTFILDSSFFKHISRLRDVKIFFTVKEVLEELSKKENYRKVLESFKVEVKAPKKENIDFIREKALEVGILDYLSKPDIKLCALAHELKNKDPIILTLDYYIQNLCYFVSIKFGCVEKKCIKYAKIFRYKCDNCGKENKKLLCEKCGNPGKRYVIKVYKLEKNKHYVEL